MAIYNYDNLQQIYSELQDHALEDIYLDGDDIIMVFREGCLDLAKLLRIKNNYYTSLHIMESIGQLEKEREGK